MTLFIITLFLMKHDTPVVRSSDEILSFLHLMSILSNFIGVICLYNIPLLEVETCIGRSMIYSVAYTLHVSCLYTKSQKLVTAFSSNLRLSASEVRNTLLSQIFTTVILLLITNGCLFIFHVQIEQKFRW